MSSESRELIGILRAFLDIQSAQLRRGDELMSGLTNLQAAVARLQGSVDEALARLDQVGAGEDATLNSIANTLLGLASELESAAQVPTASATSPATSSSTAPASSSATSTASASSSASASAPASSSSTSTAEASPRAAAARRRPATPPAGDGVFRG